MPHPGFSERNLSPVPCSSSDIALLHFESPANANRFLELGALPPKAEILPSEYPCHVNAWGGVSGE